MVYSKSKQINTRHDKTIFLSHIASLHAFKNVNYSELIENFKIPFNAQREPTWCSLYLNFEARLDFLIKQAWTTEIVFVDLPKINSMLHNGSTGSSLTV